MAYRVTLDGTPYNSVNFSELKIPIEKFTEFGAYLFRRRLSDTLKFRKSVSSDAYSYILQRIAIEQCQQVEVVIEQMCGGAWEPIISGYFTRQGCKINYENCVIEVDVKVIDEFSCIIDNADSEVNFLADSSLTIEDIQYSPIYGLEVMAVPTVGVCSAPIADWGTPYAPGGFSGYCIYARYVVRTQCVGGIPQEPPPAFSAWTLLSNDCAIDGTSTWWREAKPTEILLSFTLTSCTGLLCTPPVCSLLSLDAGVFPTTSPIGQERVCAQPLPTQFNIPNTRKFTEVLELLVSTACPLYTLSSELLTNEINPVTGEPRNPLTDLYIAAKSDVVNPTASSWATIGKLSLRDILADSTTLLNAAWTVDSATSQLVFEHITGILSNVIGVNLLTLDGGVWAAGKNAITYDKDQTPRQESFKYAAPAQGIDFVGFPITYDQSCAGSMDLPRQTAKLETELTRIFQNPNEGLEGFVLILLESILQADNKAANGYLTNLFVPNAPLSWANLHNDYFKYDRFLFSGNMNNSPTSFLSTKPIARQENVVFPMCCLNDFDPLKLIKTGIGDGRVETAIYDINSEKITVTLKFEDLP